MLTQTEATKIALDALVKLSHRSPDFYAFYDQHAQCKRYGWVLFFNSRQYIETGDFLYSLGGNGPIVVLHDGSTHFLGTAKRAETSIQEFESEHGLG